MKVAGGGNLGLSREYPYTLFGPIFYSWWNYSLSNRLYTFKVSLLSKEVLYFFSFRMQIKFCGFLIKQIDLYYLH